MASWDECAETLTRVATAHPPMTPTEDMARVWFDVLGSVPAADLDAATTDVLGSWTSTYPPGPGAIKTAAMARMRAASGRATTDHVPGGGDRQQAQHIQALKANVAAAMSLDSKTRAAGKSGAVYRRIADAARRAGTADLPDWEPPQSERPSNV